MNILYGSIIGGFCLFVGFVLGIFMGEKRKENEIISSIVDKGEYKSNNRPFIIIKGDINFKRVEKNYAPEVLSQEDIEEAWQKTISDSEE
jgi:hypothetical protein